MPRLNDKTSQQQSNKQRNCKHIVQNNKSIRTRRSFSLYFQTNFLICTNSLLFLICLTAFSWITLIMIYPSISSSIFNDFLFECVPLWMYYIHVYHTTAIKTLKTQQAVSPNILGSSGEILFKENFRGNLIQDLILREFQFYANKITCLIK